MKKVISAIFMVCLLGLLYGCKDAAKIEDPVYFYYPVKSVTYNTSNGVIAPETREGKGLKETPSELILLYLQGPLDPNFQNPFPKELAVRSYAVLDTEIFLELTNQYSQLAGLDQTIANASIARTLFRLTDTEKITIITEGIAQPQVIYASDLLLEDVPVETSIPEE